MVRNVIVIADVITVFAIGVFVVANTFDVKFAGFVAVNTFKSVDIKFDFVFAKFRFNAVVIIADVVNKFAAVTVDFNTVI